MKAQINIFTPDGENVETVIEMHEDDTDYFTGTLPDGRVIEFWGPKADRGEMLPTTKVV